MSQSFPPVVFLTPEMKTARERRMNEEKERGEREREREKREGAILGD